MTRHLVIYSTGRAGSNRLLDMLDQHRWTNCRNEPMRIQPELTALWTRDYDSLAPSDYAARWTRLVRNARFEQGAADRLNYKSKAYLRALPSWIWSQIARRTKLRRAVGISENVWRLPKICLKPNLGEDQIFPVLKLAGNPAPLLKLHPDQPEQFLLHTLRRPDRYLQSWFNRYIVPSTKGFAELQQHTRDFLSRLLPAVQADRLPKDDTLETLVRLELIKWRACHEPLLTELGDQNRQMVVTYEQISADPVAQATRIFAWLNLDLPQRTRDRIAGLRNTLFSKPHREEIPSQMVVNLMAETLSGSALLSLWQDWPLARSFAPQNCNSATNISVSTT